MNRFQSRWLAWQGNEQDAPPAEKSSAKSAKNPTRDPFGTFGTSVSGVSRARHNPPAPDILAGDLAAVKLTGTVIGDVWLVRDPEALADNPDIVRSGLPVIFFDEVEQLRGKTPEELKAVGMVKAAFPTSRVLQ